MRATASATVEVEVRRPREDVWAFLVDVSRLPEWLDEFVEAHTVTTGAPGIGSVASYTITPGPRTGTFELVEWDPPRRMAFAGPPLRSLGGGAAPRGSFELTKHGSDGTHLRCRFEPELSGLAVLLKPYATRWLRRRRSADVQKLKTILESNDG